MCEIFRNDLIITVLAAGMGKRMKSDLPKVLHKIKGIPMIIRILSEAKKMNPKKIIVIVGPSNATLIKESIQQYFIYNDDIIYAYQEQPLGTGDAIKSTINTLSLLNDITDKTINIVLNGDTPLLKMESVSEIYNNAKKNKYEMQITCIELENPTGNGRIILEKNRFSKIVEEKDCNDQQKKINIVNCGIYVLSVGIIKKYIPLIQNNNAQNEYYLTDIVEIYKNHNIDSTVGLYVMKNNQHVEIMNVNTKEQLEELENILNL